MVTNEQRRILLASGSPRRREILQRAGFELVVAPPNVPEELAPGETPQAYTRRLAEAKSAAALDVLGPDDPNWVLAADTIVVIDDEVLEKPTDANDAVEMLMRLQDRWHTVLTSFCWRNRDGRTASTTTSTRVRFRPFDRAFARRYVRTGEPMDKAGAYGIQDVGAALVREVDGSYFAVVGLPICQVIEMLEELDGLADYPFST